jgi:hypothetical protein
MSDQYIIGKNDRVFAPSIANIVTYSGPGDIKTFDWWGGMRAYSRATIGSPAIRVMAADTTQTDIVTLFDGSLDAATLAAFIVAHGSCVLMKVYDQSGNGNDASVISTYSPAVLANALNTSYGIDCSTEGHFGTSATFSASQPYAMVSVLKATSYDGSQIFMSAHDSAFEGAHIQFAGTSPPINQHGYAGNDVETPTTKDVFHAFQFVFNGASSVFRQEASEVTLDAGSHSLSGVKIRLFSYQALGSNFVFDGIWLESGYCASTIGSSDRDALNSNMHAAYGGF